MADAPVKRFRIGNVTASVWKNEGTEKSFFNVTLRRSYKDGDDWKDSDSLAHGDLLNASMVLTRAEAWIGEHHSGGFEIISSPEIFWAMAAERTRHIRLGSGVISLPYHNPFMIANRVAQLDHMTRGRFMFGFGPGALAGDAYRMGVDPEQQRRMMHEAIDVIMPLLRGEMVNAETDWLLILSGAVTALPLVLFATGAPLIPMYMIGFLQYIAPTMMLFIGVLMYGEEFNRISLISFSFIWVALILFTASKVSEARKIRREKVKNPIAYSSKQ